MREQLSTQSIRAQYAQGAVDFSADEAESIVRILEAACHRPGNLPRRQSCRSPGQEALPGPSDRRTSHSRRTTCGSGWDRHVPRSGPVVDAEATASKAGSPCSPSDPGCRVFWIDKCRAMAGRQVPWQRVLPPDRRSDGPERAARRSGTTPLGEVPQGGRSHVASSRASSLRPAGRSAPGARLYLGEGSEKLHETHGRGHVSARPCPPSVTRVDPVTNDADSCARNMTPAAISSGVVLRPSGPAAAAAASNSSWEPVAT